MLPTTRSRARATPAAAAAVSRQHRSEGRHLVDHLRELVGHRLQLGPRAGTRRPELLDEPRDEVAVRAPLLRVGGVALRDRVGLVLLEQRRPRGALADLRGERRR